MTQAVQIGQRRPRPGGSRRAPAPPYSHATGERAAGPGVHAAPLVRPLRVLVADDCRDTTDSMAELVGLWGHDAGRAYTGAAALELAADGREAADLLRVCRPAIDVVLMDVCMPGRDGPATLADLRRQDPQVRCCFMSGDLGGHTEDGLRRLGTGAVLRKPFTAAEAGRVLREEIDRREGEDAAQDDRWRDDGGQGRRPVAVTA